VSVPPEHERRIWAEWNALPDDELQPVRTIARRLGLEPAEVALVVYPPPQFGDWTDDDEPLELEAGRPPIEGLAAVLGAAEQWCQENGASFPDLLREVLEVMAADLGGTEGLVRTRPGSWEAQHLRALAAGADR
jgi:hypothetical protein